MHIWTSINWRKYYKGNQRTGLRLVIEKSVNDEVKRACKDFASWLRKEYSFPVRVPVYIKASKTIKARDGEFVTGTFFMPDNMRLEPYMRIATGDYKLLVDEIGKDNALASILATIAHELTHYFQWINNIKLTEIGYERQARAYEKYIIEEYSETRDHP